MKIKEIRAGAKISKNYNSYQINLAADLEIKDSLEKAGEILIERAISIINKRINENSEENNLKEVGAAWFSKESSNKLSVQYSKMGKFQDVELKDLEEIKDGFKQNTNEGVFVFRKISEEKRRNNKMPVLRIYKEEKNEKRRI